VQRRFFSLLVFLPLVLLACPKEDDPIAPVDAGPDVVVRADADCPAGYLGDPNLPIEMELRALRADGKDVPIAEGDDLAVLFPPQGGRVAFVGVHARNLNGCAVQLIGALRDPLSKRVRLDGRTVNLRKEPDGWGTTGRGAETDIGSSDAIGDYSNMPLCPNQWADQDVFDVPFELEVVITDKDKKTATKKIMVTPRCAEPGEKETACRCLCRNGYILGETCGEDAGVDAPL
jgi:hypothetical protein